MNLIAFFLQHKDNYFDQKNETIYFERREVHFVCVCVPSILWLL